jgi:hypothetical protein
MHLSIATSISAVALLSSASARIIGISAPKTIAQQTPFTLTLLTENYIQSVYDVRPPFLSSSFNPQSPLCLTPPRSPWPSASLPTTAILQPSAP